MSRPDVPFWRRVSIPVIDNTRGVLDGTDNGFLWLNRAGEMHLPVDSVADMVNKLKRMCTSGMWRTYLYRIWIVGHGNRTGQDIGADFVSNTNVGTHRAKLAELRSHFCAGAEVTMGGCRVGYATQLLRAMSSAFGGVPVRAGTANQRAFPGLEGGVRSCTASSCTYSGRTIFDELDD